MKLHAAKPTAKPFLKLGYMMKLHAAKPTAKPYETPRG